MKERIKKPFLVKLGSFVISPEDAKALMDRYGLKNRIEVRQFVRGYGMDEIFTFIELAKDYNDEESTESEGQ